MPKIFGDIARHLFGIKKSSGRSTPQVTFQIARLEPGKFRLPETPETTAARVVHAQSDIPYEEWLEIYRNTGRSVTTRRP